MTPLPKLMVALNGARKTKADHPNLPMTLEEILPEAIACHKAGADAIHLHVRDTSGAHSLDIGLYQEALTELHRVVPELAVQITTEAVGHYSPEEQRAVVEALQPKAVSVALCEMFDPSAPNLALDFYERCHASDVAVQHILYGGEDLTRMQTLLERGELRHEDLQLLFVLGRYTQNQQSQPQDLDVFTAWHAEYCPSSAWGVCAFGAKETQCLAKAHSLGGHVRIGFENSFINADGTVAASNAERVADFLAYIS